MHTLIKIWLLSVFPAYAFAQSNLLPEAEKVKKQYDYLVKEERAALSQVDFITAFPDDKETFLKIFYPYKLDQLYEARHQYMAALKRLGELYPQKVLAKTIGIGKDMKGNEDIVGDLQEIIIGLADRHLPDFAAEVKKLDKKQLPSFAAFLADARDNEGVAQICRKLEKLGENKIAGAIHKAMEDKSRQPE